MFRLGEWKAASLKPSLNRVILSAQTIEVDLGRSTSICSAFWTSLHHRYQPRVYLETTIPSYLAARTSRDLVVAAHQELTGEWWNQHRFSLFISAVVIEEAASGGAGAAARRSAELRSIAVLEVKKQKN